MRPLVEFAPIGVSRWGLSVIQARMKFSRADRAAI